MKKLLSLWIAAAMLICNIGITLVFADTDSGRNTYEEQYNVAYYQGGIYNGDLIDPDTFPYINKITSVEELDMLSLARTEDVEAVNTRYDEAFFEEKFLAVISWVEAQGARTRYLYDVDVYEVGSEDDFFSPTMATGQLDGVSTTVITPYCAVLEVPVSKIDLRLSVKCIDFDVEPTPAPLYAFDGGVEIIPPTKTVYVEGEYLDLTGMEAYGTSGIQYDDGSVEITNRDALTNVTVDLTDRPLTVEDTTVTVTGEYWITGGVRISGTFDITVLPTSEVTPEPPCYEVVTVPAPVASAESGAVPYGERITFTNESGIGTLMYSFYGNSWYAAESPLKLIIGDETTVSVKVSVDSPEPNKEYICEEATYTYTIDSSLEATRNEYEEEYNISYYNGGIGNAVADGIVEPYGYKVSSVEDLSSLWVSSSSGGAAVKAKYDEGFFNENFLIVISWEEPQGANEHYVEKIEYDENDFSIETGEALFCGSSTDAFTSFCAILEVPISEDEKALELNGKYFYVPALCIEPTMPPAEILYHWDGGVEIIPPTKTVYVEGEYLDLTGMEAYGTSGVRYSDGTSEITAREKLAISSIEPSDRPLTVEDTTVTVTGTYWVMGSVPLTGTFNITVLPASEVTPSPTEVPLEQIKVEGDGSEENPFVINTARELMAMPYYSSDSPEYIKHYILGSDIDLSAYGNGYNDGKGWTPVGETQSGKFYGVFDGNGKTISGLYINDPTAEASGLFGTLMGGEVKNLILKDVYINGGDNTGAVAGIGDSRIPGDGETGNSFSIHHCYVAGTVTGADNTGGIVGATNFGGVSRCCVDASVGGNNNVGGIVGDIGTHSGASSNMSRNSVTGVNNVGGIAGSFAGENGTFARNYSTGKISGTELVGGIVGLAGGMSWSTVTGNVSIAEAVEGDSQVGRIAGYDSSTFLNNYAYSDVKVIIGGEEQEISGGANTMEGETVTADELYQASFWESINYTDTDWKIEDTKLPILLFMEDMESGGEYKVTFNTFSYVQVYTDSTRTEYAQEPYMTTNGELYFDLYMTPGGGDLVGITTTSGYLECDGYHYVLKGVTEDTVVKDSYYTGPYFDVSVQRNGDNSVTAEIDAAYATAIAPSGTIIFAAYADDGALYTVKMCDMEYETMSFVLTDVPENVNTFKAMWWESMTDMKPIAEAEKRILE